MTKSKEIVSLALYFSCEWLFCFLVLLPIMAGQWALLIPFIVLALIHCSMLLLLRQMKHSSLASFLLVAVVTGLLALFILDLSFFASALLTAMLTYFSLRNDEGKSADKLWRFVLVFSSIVVIYALFARINHPNALFLLLLAELAAAITWISLNNGLGNRWLSILSTSFITVAAILTLVAGMLKPLVAAVYDFLFYLIIRPITYGISTVLFGWLNGFSNKQTGRRIQQALQGSNTNKHPSQGLPPDGHPLVNFGLLFGLLIAVVLVFIVFRQLRRIKISKHTAPAMTTEFKTRENLLFADKDRKRSVNRFFPPKHPVRRAIYKLQKLASKHKCGRGASETLSDWLKRLNLSDKDVLMTAYEKVRYGGKELTESELNAFLKTAKKAEQQLNKPEHQENDVKSSET
ncbi:hypothetical protein [Sporolactobacillus nakayamae]|uniref:DUF4129 domain-containing protein n=1 Tax=Sporolactobacillus nakayamae TaxID=269670 RepID=A0A1I2NF80_9BACL|nr:hypothetical protein [Sporolactobacillus nakayamae]SFG00001.1 hypothetical protein SAMN02982927_00350 [Sporolactobacillus nakayamae]